MAGPLKNNQRMKREEWTSERLTKLLMVDKLFSIYMVLLLFLVSGFCEKSKLAKELLPRLLLYQYFIMIKVAI